LDPNRNSMQKRGEGGRLKHHPERFLQKRITDLTEKFDGDTQRVRAQLIMDLQALQEVAVQQVFSTRGKKATEQQNWVKIAAYISQVINGIGKTYDITQIKTELEQLRKTVGDLEKQ
jgi:hypothetical protein